MKIAAVKAGLDAKNQTNHSGRESMIQKLNDEGVPHPDHGNLGTVGANISNILCGHPGVPGSLGF